jgi:ubiquinone/menaquinone biosynthesis C-methylase UbiE
MSTIDSLPHDLAYFTEWGGRSWKMLVAEAIAELEKSGGLNGRELLDVGTRFGKMAVLFSLLGAKVTGVDISEQSLSIAKEEARKWDVSNIDFIAYDGDLDIFPDASFDIVFTKSVLVVLPDLETFLRKLSKKLRPGGRFVFLENGKGNLLLHALRRVRHRRWVGWRSAHYFTDEEIRVIGAHLQLDVVRKRRFPPLYLLMGYRRF